MDAVVTNGSAQQFVIRNALMADAMIAHAHFGFNCGKRITSRMLSWPRSIIQRRSMPMPMPPAGRHAVFEGDKEIFIQHRVLTVGQSRSD
jgi:hypothetical protein